MGSGTSNCLGLARGSTGVSVSWVTSCNNLPLPICLYNLTSPHVPPPASSNYPEQAARSFTRMEVIHWTATWLRWRQIPQYRHMQENTEVTIPKIKNNFFHQRPHDPNYQFIKLPKKGVIQNIHLDAHVTLLMY